MIFIGYTSNAVKKFDLFSRKIMFTYKGNSEFSTLFGGLVSLAILSLVGVYFLFLMQTMINRSASNNTLSTEVINLNTEDQNYYLYDYGFRFGVSITDGNGNPVVLDPSYFKFDIVQSTAYKSSEGYQISNQIIDI